MLLVAPPGDEEAVPPADATELDNPEEAAPTDQAEAVPTEQDDQEAAVIASTDEGVCQGFMGWFYFS